MTRSLRMALVLLLATSILVVIPGEGDATLPGAIDRILFSSNADHASWEIYSRDFDGNSPLRLTNNAVNDYDAMWSPDGRQILFNRSPNMGVIDVMIMSSEGLGATNLTPGSATIDVALDWSPDGLWILYTSNANLWVMHPDGSGKQRLTNNSYEEWTGNWSSDGTSVVFDRQGDLWLIDADGSNERPLLVRAEHDSQPVWSPDGQKIAFVSRQSGVDNIWIMNADGTQPYSLTNSIAYESREPAWAPDGSRIAFSSDRDGDWDIWMMNPDGTNPARLTDNPADERFAGWESRNRAPVALDDEGGIVHRGQSVEIDPLANDHDPDGGVLTVEEITRPPTEGSIVINPSGTVTYAHSGVTVPPGHAVPYSDSFEYRVEDNRQGSSYANVQVWIYPYFDDVPDASLFFDHVVWLAVEGITYGCNPPANTLFCPTDYVTRGQMAAFLVRARGYTAGTGADLFIDDNGSVFEVSIDRLGTSGVTKGCNPPRNDRFCPESYVTRGQMAAFLARAFALPDLGMHDLFVDDNDSIFAASIDKLGATGVSKGCNPPHNDQFCPNQYVTRQQMAAFISRAMAYGQE